MTEQAIREQAITEKALIEQMAQRAIEKRLGDLERRLDTTRDYLFTLASALVAGLAVALFDDHVKPASGIYTDIIVS
jgi:hypothetical protein